MMINHYMIYMDMMINQVICSLENSHIIGDTLPKLLKMFKVLRLQCSDFTRMEHGRERFDFG